ncbi:MAG: hypothetical protein E7613_04260 [Ruminococcaceae bacterium]|nr:hypothetical protein [Oscillospiraceae bacterium]
MKRTLSLLLVFALLLSVLVMAVSCGSNEEEKKTSDKKTSGTVTPAGEGDIFAERAAIADELPENDFGGRKFRIAGHRTDEYFIKEEDRNKGNLIADAKYSRNKSVEDRFNCEIEVAYQAIYYDVQSWVEKNVLSGADEFDLFCSHSASAGTTVLKNIFLNWYDIPHIDFSKPWWAASCATDLTYDGKCILAISDFNYTATSGATCLVFNKNLANSYDMGNLYEIVLNGDWTFDYFYNLVKDIYIDQDGSGDKSDGDFFGFAQSYSYGCGINPWLWAFDNPTVTKNEEGIPTLSVKTDKINNIVKSIYDMVFNTTGVHYVHNNEDRQGMDLFLAKQAVFSIASIGSPTGEGLRNFEDEYGLLPLPKWDENQTNYYTMSPGEHTVLAVPKTVKDVEFVGTVIEALSAESYKQVTPTLYEIALKTRYLRDNESKEILDIIIDGRMYEFGYLYDGFQGFAFMLSGMFGQNNNNFESYYAKKYGNARIHFKKVVKVFDKMG